jgi:hypothetical protein
LGFVVKIVSKHSTPRWLVNDEYGAPSDFGARDQAIVFPTHEIAEQQAKRWAAVLEPAMSVVVESDN